MKKIINQITALTFIMMLFYSCESFIDLEPLDQITSENYWRSSGDLENYINQFYPEFYPYTQMVNQIALHSDDMIWWDISNIMDGQRTTRTGNWRGEWAPIRDVNIFFENYQNCEDPLSSYQQYLGEAYFFRAWIYFDMLRTYGDLPWYDEVLDLDDEDELMRPRDPRTLIADNILDDLDNAISNLGYRTDVGNNRINKEAALAFKTRVALYEGTWQKYHANTPFGTPGADPNSYFLQCVNAAEELMNGSYSVGIFNTGNPDNDYFWMFGQADMNDIDEVLLYRAFNYDDGFGNYTENYLMHSPNGKGATWSFITSYLGRDGQPYDYMGLAESTKGNAFLTEIANDCDPRLKSTIYMPGDILRVSTGEIFDKPGIQESALQLCPTGYQVKKSTNPESIIGNTSFSETGLIILRYGEVLLNYAEAKWEHENSVAYTQLNLLRERAGMPDFVVNPQNSDLNRVDYGYPISDELYEIRRERRVELAFEGLRDDDLMRWAAHSLFQGKRPLGYPVSYVEFPDYNLPVNEDGLIDYYADALPNGYQFRENVDYLYSIPQDELTLNPNLEQNPGW
jgi:hypothetical protein